MHASGNWIHQKDEQMLLSFSAFDFCVSGSALCPKAAFLAISSQRLMLLLNKEKQCTGSQGNNPAQGSGTKSRQSCPLAVRVVSAQLNEPHQDLFAGPDTRCCPQLASLHSLPQAKEG